jgi:tetratricopeptide (TPR) repeat protein
MKRILIPAAALVAVALLSLTWVGSGEIVVRESYGGDAVVLDAGLHLRVFPFHRLYRYETEGRTLDEALEIVTRDKATFKLPVTLAARVSPGDVLTFHGECSGRDPELFFDETVRAAVQQAAKSLNADEILNPATGGRLAQAASAELISRGIADDGLEVGAIRPHVALNAVLDYLNRQFVASGRQLAEGLLSAAPDEPLYHAAIGAVLEAEGKPKAAERAYLEALVLNPAAPEPMSRLFLMLQSRGDAESILQLERLLDAAIHKAPESAVHYDWLGQVYLRMGQLESAESAFTSALRLAPGTPAFHISLGSLRVRQNDVPAARAAYEKALELQPDHALALFNLGTTYALENDLDRAIEYFRRAEGAGPANPAILNALAMAFEEKGEAARAADYLRRSLELQPDQPDRQATLKRLEATLR